jgi:hypothetical protein
MKSAEENPYALQAASGTPELPEAPPSEGWALEGNRLIVSRDALLPMVDPYDGTSQETMRMRPVRIPLRPFWHLWFLVGGFGGILLGNIVPMGGLIAKLGAIACILYGIIGLSLGSARFHIFCSARSERQTRVAGFIHLIFLLSVVGMFAALVYESRFPTLSSVLGILFIVSTVVMGVSRYLTKRLTCRDMVGGKYEIRGLHPDALEYLRKCAGKA